MFVPPGWTEADVLRELIDAPTRAYVPFDGLEVRDEPDWAQLTCAAFRTGGFNGVSRARLRDVEADRRIDETIDAYRQRGLAFRWSVMPDSTPADLAERLRARGLRSHEVVAMARSTDGADALAPDVEVRVVDTATVDDFTRVMAEGWGAPPGALADYNRVAVAAAGQPHKLFLASVAGAPAGVGSAMFFARSVYLLGGVVLERFRRHGVYDALTRARLSLARAQGIPLATCHAMAQTSAPLLAKRGFDAWFRFPNFS